MVNPFLSKDNCDIETAILFEKAYIHDIGKAIAYTDGDRIFINTEDNLDKILPAYNDNMLKWLLWHERFHKELRHHNRFFKYLSELSSKKVNELDKNEVNIIMDILVHDSLIKLFPELVETAANNLAQLRNRNSLSYTFTTFTLEEMLEEYREHKAEEKTEEEKEKTTEEETTEEKTEEEKEEKGEAKEDKTEEEKEESSEDLAHEQKPDRGEHDDTDWSKLEDIDPTEFIEKDYSDHLVDKINKLKNTKFKLGQLTKTLNGLVTTTRKRTYARPSTIQIQDSVIMKGRTPGKTSLYLCFDASGSMAGEMALFKEIITKSIPQALTVTTVWFSGHGETVPPDPQGRSYDYYKGTFKDFLPVRATNGYNDDGDRTIELCWKAEQLGYSPIGVTDGGGSLTWSKDMAKQLKRTVLVGQTSSWLSLVKSLNNKIQIIEL